jgi:hypothetical protein
MAKRRTVRVGATPEAFTGPGIDPRSGEIAIYYVEGEPVPGEVPARDLNGGDLDRIAYQRAWRAADGERPGPISPEDLAVIADELVASGAFSRDLPRGTLEEDPDALPDGEAPAPDESPTTEPVTPAEEPEA